MEKVTAVLIEKGPKYPEIVLERILADDFFEEILIVENCPSIYHRYLAAAKARNPVVYLQDSDCMVNHQVLFSKYDGRITNTMTKPFLEKYKDLGCTLIGWGAFFPKSMLGVFDRYIDRYGVDDHLLREADRIFTYLNQPFNTVIQPHEDLFSSKNSDRMGYQNNHYTSMSEALEKCKTLAIQASFQ
jgi:hypothetical protein